MDRADKRRSPRAWLAGAAAAGMLLALFVGLELLRANEPLALDQGLFACFGRWVPRGWLPYRDLFDSKPPLFLYTWVVGCAFGGEPATAMWRFEALWLAGTMALAGALAARLWGGGVGVVAAGFVLVGLWSPGWGGYWSRAQAEELLALPMLGAAWLSVAARQRPSLAWWTGVVTGVVGLYKIPGMAVAAVWPLAWLAWCGGPAAWRMSARMAAGLALPWALAAGWFAAHGALGSFYEAVFVYQRHIAAFIAPGWGEVLSGFALTLLSEVPWLLLLAAAGLTLGVRRGAAETRWLALWIATTATAVVLQRQLAGYHFMMIAPALALAAAFGAGELFRLATRGAWRAPRILALALSIASVALMVRSAVGLAAFAPLPPGGAARVMGLVGFQRGIFSPAVEEALAHYLHDHTQADEGILVWGLGPGIYALADRHPTTRWPFHKVLLTDAQFSTSIPGLEQRRAELIARLTRDPPRYIVVGRGDANPFDPEASTESLERFGELEQRVARDYREETEVGRFIVYRRRAASDPAAGGI